jgi:hypothetical protein
MNTDLLSADERAAPTPIPVQRSPFPAQRSRPIRPNRFLSGLAAIAAVLLIVLGATIFSLFGNGRISHPGPVLQQHTCAPNLASAQLPADVRLTDLAMISPNEGWLIGGTYDPKASGPSDISTSLILHYSHCRWTGAAALQTISGKL